MMPFLLLQNEEGWGGGGGEDYFIRRKNIFSLSSRVTLAMVMWITQVASEQAENHPGKRRTFKMSQISQMSLYFLLRTHHNQEQNVLKCTQLKYTGRSSFIPGKYTSELNLVQKTLVCMCFHFMYGCTQPFPCLLQLVFIHKTKYLFYKNI